MLQSSMVGEEDVKRQGISTERLKIFCRISIIKVGCYYFEVSQFFTDFL